MSLHQLIWSAIANDPGMWALGISDQNLFTRGIDSPTDPIFAVLAWGIVEPGPSRDSRVTVANLSFWAYNKVQNMGPVDEILDRARVLLPTLIGQSHGTGTLNEVDWRGRSVVLFDDGYNAIARNDTYRLPAS